jgi:hypothetical protein
LVGDPAWKKRSKKKEGKSPLFKGNFMKILGWLWVIFHSYVELPEDTRG